MFFFKKIFIIPRLLWQAKFCLLVESKRRQLQLVVLVSKLWFSRKFILVVLLLLYFLFLFLLLLLFFCCFKSNTFSQKCSSENKKDWDELQESNSTITQGLDVHFVRWYDDVFKLAFVNRGALAGKKIKFIWFDWFLKFHFLNILFQFVLEGAPASISDPRGADEWVFFCLIF